MKTKSLVVTMVATIMLLTFAFPVTAQEGPVAMTQMEFCGGYTLSVPSDWFLWRMCDLGVWASNPNQFEGVAFFPDNLSQHLANVSVTAYSLIDLRIADANSTQVIADLFQVHLWEVERQNGFAAAFFEAISAEGLLLIQGVYIIPDQDALVLVVVELAPEEIEWMDEAYEIVHSFEYRPSK